MSFTRDTNTYQSGTRASLYRPPQISLLIVNCILKYIVCPAVRRSLADRTSNHPKQCFVQRNTYATLFGTVVNDDIEKRPFEAIDTNGALPSRRSLARMSELVISTSKHCFASSTTRSFGRRRASIGSECDTPDYRKMS